MPCVAGTRELDPVSRRLGWTETRSRAETFSLGFGGPLVLLTVSAWTGLCLSSVQALWDGPPRHCER